MCTRVLIFVVAYNAERTLGMVLSRIPAWALTEDSVSAEVLVIDDASTDATFEVGAACQNQHPWPVTVLKNPVNLGYGGNQKLGYQYALEQGFDIVVLLHGDGQYAPECLPVLLRPLLLDQCDVVLGSRMMQGGAALRGGMPLYKYVGNRILTMLQNRLVGASLTEWHSGYRLYTTRALRRIPFEANSDGFDFDTDIIVQCHAAGLAIRELPIPTYYGDEICYVNGFRYGLRVTASVLQARLQRWGILYNRKFDVSQSASPYRPKFGFASSHQLALDRVAPSDRVLVAGCGPANVLQPFRARCAHITALDMHLTPAHGEAADALIRADLDCFDPSALPSIRYDRVLLLDVVEHLRDPERLLASLRANDHTRDAVLVVTVPNVAFAPVRLMLLAGAFNYGTRGILDRTHTRLFTFRSLRRLLLQQGYTVRAMQGIPAPFPLALGDTRTARLLLRANQWFLSISRGLSAYQIYAEATPAPDAHRLLASATRYAAQLRRG